VHRQVPCWSTEAAILHRCDADGANIRPISANVEHENTPCMLPDGRVLYMRWEYVDRHEGAYHHLWTVNPDGTNVMAYYGNQWAGGVYLDAQAIPGTPNVLFVDSPGHGVSDHYGFLTLLEDNGDPDSRKRATRIGERKGIRSAPKDVKGAGLWGRDPYPLSDQWFLYAGADGIHLATFEGETQLIYSLPDGQTKALQHGGKLKGKELALECHEPRPLRPRRREPVIPDRVDWGKTTGRLVLADVTNGRNMAGVKPGEIKKIQVLEILPKPCGSNDVNLERPDRTYRFLKRVLGEFPVESDGSAYVELPAMRALQFIALDERHRSVKHMFSFVSLMPGEVLSCAGCHEPRARAVRYSGQPMALRRLPSSLQAVAGVPEVLDFPRDVQPVLDRHCVKCHNADDQAGRTDLSGDRGTWRSFGFINLVRDGRASLNVSSAGNRPPHSYGSGASPILRWFERSHENVKVSETEMRLLLTWLDAGVTYRGAYIAAPHQAGAGKADDVLASRCVQCHKKDRKDPEKEKPQFWLARFADERLGIMPRALLFNLTRPEKSVALRAPLAKNAGGLGWCLTPAGAPVFADTNDSDYQALLADMAKGREAMLKAEAQGLGGNAAEKLKLYGILPATFDPRRDPAASVFELERKYFEMTYPKLHVAP
jgi:mono/diheme cytochrome c family protein